MTQRKMESLTERLTRLAHEGPQLTPTQLALYEARDEIDRLRAALREIGDIKDTGDKGLSMARVIARGTLIVGAAGDAEPSRD